MINIKNGVVRKKELIDFIAKRTEYSKKEIEEIINLYKTAILYNVWDRKNVQIKNFGTFRMVKKKARIGVLPYNGKHVKYPEHKTITFKISSKIKKEINQSPANSINCERIIKGKNN